MGKKEESALTKTNLKIPFWVVNEWFPNLRLDNHSESSPIDNTYNCFAWAAGKTDDKYHPLYGFSWFDGAIRQEEPSENDLKYFLDGFGSIGYSQCNDGKLEEGYEKVALYMIDQSVKHMARQLPNGNWTSKLGELWYDIEHTTIEAVESSRYGKAKIFMRRRIVDSN